jgi:hypothetical protein
MDDARAVVRIVARHWGPWLAVAGVGLAQSDYAQGGYGRYLMRAALREVYTGEG